MTFSVKAKLASAGALAGGGSFSVGSFEKQNTTGTQAVTGIGFVPKAIMFWTSGSDASSGVFDAAIRQSVGFTSGSSESYSVGGASSDNQGTSSTSRRVAAKALTLAQFSGAATAWEADLDSFDADGFTLDWTTNGVGGTIYDSHEIMFMAIGGEGVEAKVVNWTSPTSTINKAVTGVGFEPSVVLHAASAGTLVPSSNSVFINGFGVMDAAGNQWTAATRSNDNVATSDTYRYQATDACIALLAGATINEEASFVSMDADGFTIDFTTASFAYEYISLCLSGVDAKAGSFFSPTTARTKAVGGAGFKPAALLFASVGFSETPAVVENNGFGMGAYDGTNERSAAHWDRDALGTTQADSVWFSNKAIITPTDSAVTREEATTFSVDSDGFTLDFTKASASTLQYLYLALK